MKIFIKQLVFTAIIYLFISVISFVIPELFIREKYLDCISDLLYSALSA